MRDNLNCSAQIVTASFLTDHFRIDLTGGNVVVACQVLINETLIMTKVKVGLGAIIRDVDLAVLVRAHRPRIDVDVRVELLNGDTKPTVLENSANRRDRDAFANRRDYAAGYKQVLRHSCLQRGFDHTLVDGSSGIARTSLTPRR